MVGKLLWTNRPATPEELAEQAAARLEAAKTRARAEIDAAVRDLRLRLVTPLPGQEAIYTAKQAEAALYLAARPADLRDFPFLAAEVGLTAPTADELAQLWLNLADIFARIGAATEGARKTAESAVAAAKDPDEVDLALAEFAVAMVELAGR